MGGILLNTFLSIIVTGIPGFISYWILSQFRLVDVRKNDKDEKIILLIGLSLINVLTTFIILRKFGYTFPIKFEEENILTLSLISTITVLLLSIIFWPLLIIFIKKIIRIIKFKYKIPTDSNRTVFDEIMFNRPKELTDTQLYIFDFKNQLIIEGAAGYISHEKPELSVRNIIDASTTYDQAIKIYNDTDNINREIFINYERQIKIIIIHF